MDFRIDFIRETHYNYSKDDYYDNFSLSFEFQGRRYRAQGRYADNGEKEPDCSLRCVPMRLSDKTLRESEYSDKL